MIIGIIKEATPGEARVALVPESVKRLIAAKATVVVEKDAGLGANVTDADYQAAGAQIEDTAAKVFSKAQLICKIHAPSAAELALLPRGSTLVCLAYPLSNLAFVEATATQGVDLLALDMIPRTTLAQMMDVLSSQASIAGYRATLTAASSLAKLFPMLMTAAGTIPPARVLVVGAGVAGLQAIATARRLGAVVEAYDVRRVVKEQIESLGAKFVNIEIADASGTGGYAKELDQAARDKINEILKGHVAKADAIITTAQVPGKKAPRIITKDMVAAMRAGSVIVDMAAEQGGNCELTRPGETIVVGGVSIIGPSNLPSQVAVHASMVFSRNVEKLINHLTGKDGTLNLDTKDEIIRGLVISQGGSIVHTDVKALMGQRG
jgi:NAD(P) transhydrogenase subunit alpha